MHKTQCSRAGHSGIALHVAGVHITLLGQLCLEGRNQARVQRRLWCGVTVARIGLELTHLGTCFGITTAGRNDGHTRQVFFGVQVICAG